MGTAEMQGKLWGAAPDDWATLVEPVMTPLFEAGLDAVGVGKGTKFLDAGCGAGLALQLARARGAIVSGFDASEGLLGVARRRVPDGDIRQGDLEDLPFANDTFDAITAFNSVQYTADPVRALRELARVAKAGAPVAVATWGAADQCETASVIAAIGACLPPAPPGAEGPFALAEPGKLEALVAEAGLTPKEVDDVTVTFVSPDLETAIRGQMSTGPGRMAIEVAGAGVFKAALRAALEPSIQRDGTSRQQNVFRYVVATA